MTAEDLTVSLSPAGYVCPLALATVSPSLEPTLDL
jgi:hypothetical protein